MTFHERELLEVLSPGLRAKLASTANAPLLRRIPFFEAADEEIVAMMVMELVAHLFVPEEVVIIQGHVGHQLFIIKSGEICIFIRKWHEESYAWRTTELATLLSGNFFGEGVLLHGQHARRGASAKAVVHSVLYSLDVERVDPILENAPAIKAKIARIAAERDLETQQRDAAKASECAPAEPPPPTPVDAETAATHARSSAPAEAATPAPADLSSPLAASPRCSFGPAEGYASAAGASGPSDGNGGSGFSGRGGGAAPPETVASWAACNGLQGYVGAMAELGYDTLYSLHALTPAAAAALADATAMKPGHAGILKAMALTNERRQQAVGGAADAEGVAAAVREALTSVQGRQILAGTVGDELRRLVQASGPGTPTPREGPTPLEASGAPTHDLKA